MFASPSSRSGAEAARGERLPVQTAHGKHQQPGSGKSMAAVGHRECLLCQPGRAGAAAAGLGEDFRRKAVRAALITAAPAASLAQTSPGLLLPASSCLCALPLEGTELCWDPQLCCRWCPACPSTGKCSPGLHSHPRSAAMPGVPWLREGSSRDCSWEAHAFLEPCFPTHS